MENSWSLKDVNGKITNLRVKGMPGSPRGKKSQWLRAVWWYVRITRLSERGNDRPSRFRLPDQIISSPQHWHTQSVLIIPVPSSTLHYSAPPRHTSKPNKPWGPRQRIRMNKSERLATQWTMSYTCKRNSFKLYLCYGLQETGEKSGNWLWAVCMRVCACMFNLWPSWQIHYLCQCILNCMS